MVLDNFYKPPVNGVFEIPGGTRLTIGEIAFESATDPCLIDGNCPASAPSDFYPIRQIQSSTALTDIYPARNLIQGPGVGFEASAPYRKISLDAQGNWATESECGSGCDYFRVAPPPILVLDLGSDQLLNEIDTWAYQSTNANGVSQFELRFATSDEGPQNFGRSIAFNPVFSALTNQDLPMQSFPFAQPVRTRYVEFKATDNFHGRPGAPDGGDRMGLGEIAFRKPPSNLGDFSGNGVLDVNDVNLILQAIAEQKHPAQFDLDNRGTVDAVDLRIWVKDLKHTWFGDADLSGEFNSSDFVQVFQAAKYETGELAGWAEGDWNGNLSFDSADFITAFTDSGYEQGQRTGVSAVPEPGGVLLLILGLVGVMRRKAVECRVDARKSARSARYRTAAGTINPRQLAGVISPT